MEAPPPAYPQQPATGYPQQPAQQGYVVQNVAPTQVGCCDGQSERYKASSGLGTGVAHLVLAVLTIAASAGSFATNDGITNPYGIWCAIIFFIPTGILGVISKNRSTGVITAYLVCGILTALDAFGMMVNGALWAGIFSLRGFCSSSFGCFFYRSIDGTAVHAVISCLGLIEFIVAVIGAAFCCNGLRCCCASAAPTQPATGTVVQYQHTSQPHQVAVAMDGQHKA